MISRQIGATLSAFSGPGFSAFRPSMTCASRSGQWEYYFYIDIAGHPDTENVRHALEELRKACGFFKILGTYPVDVH